MAKSGSKFIYVLSIILILTVAGGISYYLERENPQIRLADDMDMISAHKDIAITLLDMKSGLRSYRVSLLQDDREYLVAQEELPLKGTYEKSLDIEIVPARLGIKDGKALFQVNVVDFSPLKNTASLNKEVIIDSVPPQVSLLSTSHYVNPGGTCLVIYTVSDDAVDSGVRLGDAFFPGSAVQLGDVFCYLSYVGVPMDMKQSLSLIHISEPTRPY